MRILYPSRTCSGITRWLRSASHNTLHLPSDMPLDVAYPKGCTATVVIRKVWTDLAVGSNTAEIYSDDCQLCYGPVQLASPNIPQAPELGPSPHFSGTDLEIAKDTHEVFRYTQIHVFFESTQTAIAGVDTDEAVQAARSVAYDGAMKTAKDVVNDLLDVYRYVTSAEHVERLSTMNVRRVYFADHKLGLSDADVTDRLKRWYRTKDRLTRLCREVTGGSCVGDDTLFWDSQLSECNQKRNGVVHKNEGVTYLEALRVVELCEQCITRLLVLPFPA